MASVAGGMWLALDTFFSFLYVFYQVRDFAPVEIFLEWLIHAPVIRKKSALPLSLSP